MLTIGLGRTILRTTELCCGVTRSITIGCSLLGALHYWVLTIESLVLASRSLDWFTHYWLTIHSLTIHSLIVQPEFIGGSDR